jgi:hypothetical protein
MLSEYLEELLPTSRKNEIRDHLGGCKTCSEVQRDLQMTLEIAGSIPSRPISQEASLRFAEACQAGTRRFSSARVSRYAFLALFPILIFVSCLVMLPGLFPWFSGFRLGTDESQFVRYRPLVEGAGEIIEEHGNWLHVREPAMRSLWEEGGISPEEFEKSFTAKPSMGEETK